MKPSVIAKIASMTALSVFIAPASLAAGLAQPDQSAAAPASDSVQANGDVVEFQNLMLDGKITELRKSLNGSYGASLSFYPERMIYYVALFQQSKFWRVFKTQNDARADSVYADFVKSSVTLADTEIRRIKLEAEKAYSDKQIAAQQDRANRLQADLDIARTQQSQVVTYQIEQQEAIRSLRTEQAAAQAQLRALQQRVQDLQKQSDVDIPGSAPPSTR
jgi:predicted methyltransferase